MWQGFPVASRIVVLGSINADLVVRVSRRPGPGETVLGGDTVVAPGGKGANVAVAAAKLGGDVTLIGAVGADNYADMSRDALRSAGVRPELLVVDRPSGLAFIAVTDDGENSILVSPGANSALTVEWISSNSAEIRRADVVVASLEVPVATVRHAMSVADQAGVRCVLNASPAVELPADMIARADPLLVNEHEANLLLGKECGDVAAGVLGLGARSAVITMGARGVAVATGGGVRKLPARRVDSVDSTGAGDAFAGALAVALSEGEELLEAAEFSSTVAAISVTKSGAQPSYPTREELANFAGFR